MPALSIQAPHEDIGKHTIGPHLSWDGKVAAEQPDRLTNRTSRKWREMAYHFLKIKNLRGDRVLFPRRFYFIARWAGGADQLI